MHKMRPQLAVALLALLAGCTADSPADSAGDAGSGTGPDAPRSTQTDLGASLRVLDLKESYQLDNAIPAVTMSVPGNVSSLVAQLTSSSVGPCGTVVGEPGDPLGARVVFTAPSGATHTLDANMQQCRVSVVSGPPVVATADFGAEAGEWQVTFYGRSLGVEVHLVVDGKAD